MSTESIDPESREADLVAAWRSGDRAAFTDIVRIHRRRLFAVALHKTGNAESAEADGFGSGRGTGAAPARAMVRGVRTRASSAMIVTKLGY